jgi:hypothetical protein
MKSLHSLTTNRIQKFVRQSETNLNCLYMNGLSKCLFLWAATAAIGTGIL